MRELIIFIFCFIVWIIGMIKMNYAYIIVGSMVMGFLYKDVKEYIKTL